LYEHTTSSIFSSFFLYIFFLFSNECLMHVFSLSLVRSFFFFYIYFITWTYTNHATNRDIKMIVWLIFKNTIFHLIDKGFFFLFEIHTMNSFDWSNEQATCFEIRWENILSKNITTFLFYLVIFPLRYPEIFLSSKMYIYIKTKGRRRRCDERIIYNDDRWKSSLWFHFKSDVNLINRIR